MTEPLLFFCIPPIGQGGGASADWQVVGQSPAVVGRVPGVEKSLSGAVLSGARLDRWIRPRPAPHPLTLSHALLHRDARLTSTTHSHTCTHACLSWSHSPSLERVEQTAAEVWMHQGCDQWWTQPRGEGRDDLTSHLDTLSAAAVYKCNMTAFWGDACVALMSHQSMSWLVLSLQLAQGADDRLNLKYYMLVFVLYSPWKMPYKEAKNLILDVSFVPPDMDRDLRIVPLWAAIKSSSSCLLCHVYTDCTVSHTQSNREWPMFNSFKPYTWCLWWYFLYSECYSRKQLAQSFLKSTSLSFYLVLETFVGAGLIVTYDAGLDLTHAHSWSSTCWKEESTGKILLTLFFQTAIKATL